MIAIVLKEKFKNWLLIIALLGTISIKAQEIFVKPQAHLLTKFQFIQLTGGIILIRARLDDLKDTLTFVLDTGSGGISLDSTKVKDLGLKCVSTHTQIRGIAGLITVPFTLHHKLNLPNLEVDSLDFHILNYDLLTSVYGYKIDGVIGYSLFKRFIVKINYDEQEVEVYSKGSFKYPRGGKLITPDFVPLPTDDVLLNDGADVENRFILDTGAGLCILLSEDFVKEEKVFKKKRKQYLTQTEGLGGKKQMNLSVIKRVRFQGYTFKKVPVYIFDDAYNITSYPLYGGVMGNDLLRRFNVILNYNEKHIYIKPNKHFLDSFDYGYTGLGIYQVDNRVEVVDIVPNSPGDKAGFKSGDIIVGVDKVLMKNIQPIKMALQNPGTIVKVIIKRKEELFELKLKVKNILSNR